jgi:hypothetical protein
MFAIEWIFVGVIMGLLLVSVIAPPARADMQLPTPFTKSVFRTPTGCVRFRTQEVSCSDDATSLNFIASSHK